MAWEKGDLTPYVGAEYLLRFSPRLLLAGTFDEEWLEWAQLATSRISPTYEMRLFQVRIHLVDSGIPSLDALLGGKGYPEKSAILVVGPPGIGKEALADWFAQSALL